MKSNAEQTDIDGVVKRLEEEGLGAHLSGGKERDRKSTRLNSSHVEISYAVFCLKKKISRLQAGLLCLSQKTQPAFSCAGEPVATFDSPPGISLGRQAPVRGAAAAPPLLVVSRP